MTAFPDVLRGALDQHQITAAQLARASGVSQASVSNYLTGKSVPSVRYLDRLADVLPAVDLHASARVRRRCQVRACRRLYYASRPQQRYCSLRCNGRASDLRRQRTRHQRAGGRLATALDAIAAMCFECEPKRVCHQADCPLRSLSPIPLAGSVA